MQMIRFVAQTSCLSDGPIDVRCRHHGRDHLVPEPALPSSPVPARIDPMVEHEELKTQLDGGKDQEGAQPDCSRPTAALAELASRRQSDRGYYFSLEIIYGVHPIEEMPAQRISATLKSWLACAG
jgi:hypothetical protein